MRPGKIPVNRFLSSHSRDTFFPNAAQLHPSNDRTEIFSTLPCNRLRTCARAGTRIAKVQAIHLAMKNSLTVLALTLAAATPAAFIIELAGTRLPAIVDSAHLFGAFMLTFLFKILFADYARLTEAHLAAHAADKNSLRLAA
jgi:hypothetical protein